MDERVKAMTAGAEALRAMAKLSDKHGPPSYAPVYQHMADALEAAISSPPRCKAPPQWTYTLEERPAPHPFCYDCGLPYRDFHGDVILPHGLWEAISPRGDEGGLLCPNCIMIRLSLVDCYPHRGTDGAVWVRLYPVRPGAADGETTT